MIAILSVGGRVMRGNLKCFQILLCSILFIGAPYGSMAADKSPLPPSIKGISPGSEPAPAPVTPPGNDGLLSGMASGNYKIPSGWSLVAVQDFESGSCPPTQSCTDFGAKITATRPHSGSRSIEGNYTHDQSSTAWYLNEGNTGSFSEIYLSFWEFTESQARFNDEYMIARFQAPVSSSVQDIIYDWMWAPTFNSTKATLYMVSEGEVTERWGGKSGNIPVGVWTQWEIHLRPNTPGQADGFSRVYQNGVLFTSADNKELFGPDAKMANTYVAAGGFYTKIVWMKDYPTCSIPSGCSAGPWEGNDLCVVKNGWAGQSFANPRCAPTDPPLPSFKRFIDDVIVMKKTAG